MTDWHELAKQAGEIVGTPCYVVSEAEILHAFSTLQGLESSVRLRHWLSLKTQPLPRLVKFAFDHGLGVDVVSSFELFGVTSLGIPGRRILVNGLAKHKWLTKSAPQRLNVQFDSVAEVSALAETSRDLGWRVGLRCAIPPSGGDDLHDDSGDSWDQFGMTGNELREAAAVLRTTGVSVSGLHFHLHANVHHIGEFRRAIDYVEEMAKALELSPEYINVGGGLPIAGESSLDGRVFASALNLSDFQGLLASIPKRMSSVSEVWLENGRFLSGSSGALVVTVLDKKIRGEETILICDGGRVNHARMAAMERHEIILLPHRDGFKGRSVLCGPTCATVDRLGCWQLPIDVEPGDRVIWLSAGAYHIPLETRFSQGLAPVVWFNAVGEPEVVRRRETPSQWWGQWIAR